MLCESGSLCFSPAEAQCGALDRRLAIMLPLMFLFVFLSNIVFLKVDSYALTIAVGVRGGGGEKVCALRPVCVRCPLLLMKISSSSVYQVRSREPFQVVFSL